MMKKNYLGMLMAAAAMMFAGYSLTSCSEKDVSIVNGEVYEKPEVQLTDDGAIVKGSSPADISRMMSRIKTEISDAAKAGKSFKISVDAAINSTSSDNEISIPTPPDADLVLSFTNPIKTEVPLTLKMKGAGDDATALASTNKVEIDIPSGSSEADLELIFPTSTVTLKGGAIDELTAITATNTLIIESGVTVNWFKRKGGLVIVKNGGKINGTLCDGSEQEKDNTDVTIRKDGVDPGFNWEYDPEAGEWKEVFYIASEDGKAYYTKQLKVIKGKEKLARIGVGNWEATDQFEKVIIADGAGASFSFWGSWDEEKQESISPKGIKLVEGIGNKTAKIYGSLSYNTYDGEKIYGTYPSLYYVKEIKNLTVDGTLVPDAYIWDNESQEYISLGDVKTKYGNITLAANNTDCNITSVVSINGRVVDNEMSKVTNCTLTCPTEVVVIKEDYWTQNPQISYVNTNNSKLTARQIYNVNGNSESNTFKSLFVSFTNYYLSGNSATVKNCKFESVDKENDAKIWLPYQTKDRSSFDFIFDTCAFGKGFMFNTSFEGWKPWVDKDGKQVAKGYYWLELDEDGNIKRDDDGNYIEKRSADEKDIPAANKANYEAGYSKWGGGYDVEENPTEEAEYKDYTAYITYKSTTIDGKDITAKTEFISGVSTLKDKDGNPTTATYFVIDGDKYEAVYNSNTQKWYLIATE
jgi:hypothetical protein